MIFFFEAMKIASVRCHREGSFLGMHLIMSIASWTASLQSTLSECTSYLQAAAYWKEIIPNSDRMRQITQDIDDMTWQWSHLHADIEKSVGKLKRKRYHRTDLSSIFHIRYLPDNEYAPYIQKVVDNHSSGGIGLWDSAYWEDDLNYSVSMDDKRMVDAWTDFGDNVAVIERRFHVEWINNHIGYGVVASIPIEADTILDIYSGLIKYAADSAYQWDHPRLKTTATEYIGIDARSTGNVMRFINDDPNYKNTVYLKVANRGRYYMLYKTLDAPVMKGMQLSVSYGDSYWEVSAGEDSCHQSKIFV